MLVGVFGYVLNNGLKNIRLDLKEYKKLGKKCRSLKNVKKARYNLLRGENGCIDQEVTTEHFDIAINDSDVIRDVDIVEYDKEGFIKCEYLTDSVCVNKHCPFFDRNKKYIEACNKYAEAVSAKKNFWKNKNRQM